MEDLKKRKATRLKNHDYSKAGLYFVTVCTKDRRCILFHIVGTGVLDGPLVELTGYGKIADRNIKQLNDFYVHIELKSYVIMPNHVHLMLFVKQTENGPSGAPVPTVQNSVLSQFVSTFKRFCNKEYGKNIWQYRSYDHVIRNRRDYEEIAKYIHENPIRWKYDTLYSED